MESLPGKGRTLSWRTQAVLLHVFTTAAAKPELPPVLFICLHPAPPKHFARTARISRRLIREKGFSFIAVEGDWPDCYRVSRYIKGLPESPLAADRHPS
jgi:hypothetical protein